VGDFTHLPTHCKFLALMPQWDFLSFVAEHGKRYPEFHLKMRAEVIDLIEDAGRVAGVIVKTNDGPTAIRAGLTIGADGRRSIVRERGGLVVTDLGAPMDVLWMKVSRRPGDPAQTLGRAAAGRIFIMIDREEYWQCGYVIPKGAAEETRNRGIERFREEIVSLAPFFADRIGELRDWNDVSQLTVKVDRVKKWFRPGLLCIGDSAHAMSPIGGVGINLAIQDAVATANILVPKFAAENIGESDLESVQRRRAFPTDATQKLQIAVQNRVIRRVLGGSTPLKLPFVMRLLRRFPVLRRLPARVIGMGFRPEHIRTRDVHRGH